MKFFYVLYMFVAFLKKCRCDPMLEMRSLIVSSNKLYRKILYLRSKRLYTLKHVKRLESCNLHLKILTDKMKKSKKIYFGYEEVSMVESSPKDNFQLAEDNTTHNANHISKLGIEQKNKKSISNHEKEPREKRQTMNFRRLRQIYNKEGTEEKIIRKNFEIKSQVLNICKEKMESCNSFNDSTANGANYKYIPENIDETNQHVEAKQESSEKDVYINQGTDVDLEKSNVLKENNESIEHSNKQNTACLANDTHAMLKEATFKSSSCILCTGEVTVLQFSNDKETIETSDKALTFSENSKFDRIEVIVKVLYGNFLVYYASEKLLREYNECDLLVPMEIIRFCTKNSNCDLSKVLEIILLRKIIEYQRGSFYQFLNLSKFCRTPLRPFLDSLNTAIKKKNGKYNILKSDCFSYYFKESLNSSNQEIYALFDIWTDEVLKFHEIRMPETNDLRSFDIEGKKIESACKIKELLQFKIFSGELYKQIRDIFDLNLKFALLLEETTAILDDSSTTNSTHIFYVAYDKILNLSFDLTEKIIMILEQHIKTLK